MTVPADPTFNFAKENEKNLCLIVLTQDIQRAKDELYRRGLQVNTREQASTCIHNHRFQIP